MLNKALLSFILGIFLFHSQCGLGANTIASSSGAVDVRTFGARGNGADDDTDAIQNAIQDAGASRRAVFFPQGTYKISRTLLLDRPIALVGSGCSDRESTSATVLRIATNVIGIKILAPRCRLEGFLLYADFSGHGQDGIWVGDPEHDAGGAVLRDITVRNVGGSGIWFRNGNSHFLENVSCFANRLHGIRFESSHPSVFNVNATTAHHLNLMGNLGYGLYIDRSESNILQNVIAQGNNEFGIYLNSPRNNVVCYTEGNLKGSLRMDTSAYDCFVVGTMNEGDPLVVNRGNLIFVQNNKKFTLRLFGYNPMRAMSSSRSVLSLPTISARSSYEKTLRGIVGAKTGHCTVIATPESGDKWESGRAYGQDDFVCPMTVNGFLYRCSTPGMSGAKEPVWPTKVGEPITDGTAVWTFAGSQTIEPGLVWHVYPKDTDAVIIRVTNLTDIPITPVMRPWQITVSTWDN